MADDDEVRDDASFDPAVAAAGPRRATFTPPPAGTQPPSEEALSIDDDALADALAADLNRVASGIITLPDQSIPAAAAPVEEAAPVQDPTPVQEPALIEESAPAEVPVADEPAVDEPVSVDTPEFAAPTFEVPEPVAEPEPEPEAEPVLPPGPSPMPPPFDLAPPAPEESPEPPPWSSLPAPDPSQAVPIADDRPLRRSLPDDELLEWVDDAGREPGGTLNVIEQLESQLRLREDEAREFHAWEDRMRSLGTPEALQAVEEARPEFTGVLPNVPVPPGLQTPPAPETGSFVLPETPMAEWPAPHFEDVVEPVAARAPIDEVPVFDVPAPEPSAYPVFDAPSEPEAPPSLPAWDVPAPSSTWSPGPEYGVEPDPEPELAPELVPEAEPAPAQDHAPEPELAPEQAPEQALEPDPDPEPVAEASESVLQPEGEPEPDLTQDAEPEVEPEAEPDAEPEAAPEPAVDPFDSLLAPVETPVAPVAEFTEFAPTPLVDRSVAEASLGYEPTPGVHEDVYVIDEDPIERPEEAPVAFEPAEPELEPELVEPEPEPELTTPETASAPMWSPPPLVEPPVFGGPPLLPSETHPPRDDTEPAATEQVSTEPETEGPAEPAAFDFSPDAPLPPPPLARAFSFDDLLVGEAVAREQEPAAAPEPSVEGLEPDGAESDDLLGAEEPPLHPDPEPATVADAAPESVFIEPTLIAPMPFSAGEPVPTDTGSVRIIDRAYEEELVDDTIDETDRFLDGLVGTVAVDTSGIAVVNPQASPPSGPISTVRIPEDEVVLLDNEPTKHRVFSIEESGPEPTATDQRVGRAARLFWLWFAANSSILSLGLGAAVFAVGMSLRQSIVAVLAGVALSFIPLGLTTLAGKRSGQPTMIVSRATFGLVGNVVPAVLALVTRLFWGAVLLWLLASSIAVVLVGASLDGSLGDRPLQLISLAGAFLIALLVAFAGYPLFARIQLILSIISGILIIGLIAMTARYIDLPAALTTPDGPWLLTVTGAVLVFSFVGLVWANSGADLARYQRVNTSGASSMLWATFGATLPSFLLIGYGALLAASDQGIASGFLLSPLDTLALMLPSWYPIPLIAATALSLLSGITLTMYSGGFALQSIGVRVARRWSTVVVAVLLAGLALLLTFGVSGGINELFRDLATTLAVPTAAWAGIFATETMIRNRRFESPSLTTRGGIYPDVRWMNLIGLLVISAIGFALTSATVSWLSWQGFGFTLLGVPLDSDLAGTDLGVLVALVLGLLTPIATGIPAIRRQEAARV